MFSSGREAVRWFVLALVAGLSVGFFAGRLSVPVASVSPNAAVTPEAALPAITPMPKVQPTPKPWAPPPAPVSAPPASPGPGATSSTDASLQVGRIIDGDTMEIRYRPPLPMLERVRLLRINTPERGQPGYKEAKTELDLLMSGRTARVEFEQDKPQRDKYGRLLVYVYAGETFVNLEMVRRGWSKHETRFGTGKYKAQFEQAEAEARQHRRGLWGLSVNN